MSKQYSVSFAPSQSSSERRDNTFSEAEVRALRLMASVRHFQDGVIDRYGNVVCGGEHKSISPSTWLRLVAKQCVEGVFGARLRLTDRGREVLEKLP